jgi:hypothetical protein
VGADDMWANRWGGRREVFNVADDEHLIGCELDEHEYDSGKYNWRGITWIKMKVLPNSVKDESPEDLREADETKETSTLEK